MKKFLLLLMIALGISVSSNAKTVTKKVENDRDNAYVSVELSRFEGKTATFHFCAYDCAWSPVKVTVIVYYSDGRNWYSYEFTQNASVGKTYTYNIQFPNKIYSIDNIVIERASR